MDVRAGGGSDAIRVVVASDVRLYREALERVFREAIGIDLVGTTAGAADTLEHIRVLAPDVVLLDMAMEDAFEVARQVPHACSGTRIVALGIAEAEAEQTRCPPARGSSASSESQGRLSERRLKICEPRGA